MPSAYVLINCEIGSEKHIISKLNNLSGIEEVSEVNGIYDIIVKVNSDSIDYGKYPLEDNQRHLASLVQVIIDHL